MLDRLAPGDVVTVTRIYRKFLTFLAQAYELKSITDYDVGATVPPITAGSAQEVIDTAARFIDRIAELLALA